MNKSFAGPVDNPELSWCPKSGSNLDSLLTWSSVHREERLKAEERKGELGEEKDRGERLMSESAIDAGWANVFGKM